MIYLFAALTAGLFVAALVFQDRAYKRAMEAQQGVLDTYRVECAHLVERIAKERELHRSEVQMLIQRIQAPEVAVMQHQIETAGPPEATYPYSDAEAAERQNKEILARIVELEQQEAMAR